MVVGNFSSLVAESIGLKEAFSWLKSGGFRKVIVEMDAKGVVDRFNR